MKYLNGIDDELDKRIEKLEEIEFEFNNDALSEKLKEQVNKTILKKLQYLIKKTDELQWFIYRLKNAENNNEIIEILLDQTNNE